MELSKPTTTLSLIEEDHDGGITSSLEEPLLLTSSLVPTPDFSQDEEPKNIMQEKLRLAIIFVTFIILGSLQGVSVKLVTYPMHNYANFLNLYGNLIFCLLCLLYVIPALYIKCPTSSLCYFPNIPISQTKLSKKPFAIQGSLDFVSFLLFTLSSVQLSGPLLMLLPQAAIPTSMILSKFLLQKTYTKEHWFGAITVLLGIGVVVFEQIFGDNNNDDDENSSDHSSSTTTFVWSSVVLLAVIPTAISSIYKESYSQQNEIDPIYWNLWICIFQTIYSLIFAVPTGYISEPKVSASDFLENFWGGFKCTFGYNTYNNTDYGDVEDTAAEGGSFHPDNCHIWGPLYFTVYSTFTFGLNILMVLLLKYGGANVMFLAMTLILPISDLAFALPFMPNATKLHVNDILGLLVILGGLFLYGYGESIQENEMKEDEVEHQIGSRSSDEKEDE